MWVHMRLNCHAHLCTLVPVWMWWLYGLGQIDMQYISMATLLQRGHEASVCSRGTKLILSSSKRSQNHTTSIHPPSDSSVNVWHSNKSAAMPQGSCARLRTFISFFLLFFSSCSSMKVHCLWYILKARLQEMMPDKVITDMKVKHITDCHGSHESYERHCRKK